MRRRDAVRMDVRTLLEQFKDRTTGCDAVVLGDLSSGTVLCAVTAPGRMQETHDALLALSIDLLCFGLPDAEEGEWAVEAICMTAGQTRLFLLAEAPAAEALCVVADGRHDPAMLRDALAGVLRQIGTLS